MNQYNFFKKNLGADSICRKNLTLMWSKNILGHGCMTVLLIRWPCMNAYRKEKCFIKVNIFVEMSCVWWYQLSTLICICCLDASTQL